MLHSKAASPLFALEQSGIMAGSPLLGVMVLTCFIRRLPPPSPRWSRVVLKNHSLALQFSPSSLPLHTSEPCNYIRIPLTHSLLKLPQVPYLQYTIVPSPHHSRFQKSEVLIHFLNCLKSHIFSTPSSPPETIKGSFLFHDITLTSASCA